MFRVTCGKGSLLGLKVSSEIFQRKIDEVLGDLDGILNNVGDVVIVGCCTTEAKAQRDNQQKLTETLKRYAERNIILNEDKQQTANRDYLSWAQNRTRWIGVKVDQAKVQAIREMPAPTDVEGVKRTCGKAQYMSRFLPYPKSARMLSTLSKSFKISLSAYFDAS